MGVAFFAVTAEQMAAAAEGILPDNDQDQVVAQYQTTRVRSILANYQRYTPPFSTTNPPTEYFN